MKTLTTIALLLAWTNAMALPASRMTGSFVEKHEVAFPAYPNEEACKKAQGKWSQENELCFFDGSNRVNITKKNGKLKMSIIIVSTNAHTCDFEAPVSRIYSDKLVAKAPGSVYENGEYKDATCEVTVKYLNANSVSVDNNMKCQNYCGMRAHLSVEKAIRN